MSEILAPERPAPLADAVRPEHRPTLGQLAGPWWRRRRRGARAGLAVLVVAPVLLLAWLAVRPADRGTVYAGTAPVPFTFRFLDTMTRAAPEPGEVVRVARRRPDGLFLDAFAVAPLALPAYSGEVSGTLPAVAVAAAAALRRRFSGFEWVQEGKTRINEVPAYVIVFRARQGGRRLAGRLVLLPEPVPGTRRGVRLLFLSTPAAGTSDPREMGGAARVPYRSFRFGAPA